MARSTLFRNPFFGWLLKKVGAFPLRRNFADLGAMKEALARLKDDDGLLLFPEGARSTDGQIRGGRAGVSFLARKSGVPVIPAYVKGTDKAMPKGVRWIKPCRIEIIFGQAMRFCETSHLSDKDMTEEIMKHITELRQATIY